MRCRGCWGLAAGSGGRSAFTPAVGDRETPVTAEGLERDLWTRWILPPLVLRYVHHADHLVDQVRVEACSHDVRASAVLLDIIVEDVVEQLIGRQRVRVELPGPQLSGGRLGDRVLGDRRGLAAFLGRLIPPPGEPPYECLR